MDIARAFTYLFDDEEWIPKLAIAAALVFGGVVLLPVFFAGLICWSILFGYMVELIRNLRDQRPTPLPRWDNYAVKLGEGSRVLTAILVYNIPNLLLACCIGVVPQLILGRDNITSGITLVTVCCLLPFLLLYNLTIGAMLALGTARYADEGNIVVYFQFSDLFATLTRYPSRTLTWIVMTTIANIALFFFGLIPCLGWLISPAMTVIVQGHLLGQFANQIEMPVIKPKGKPKRG